MRRNRRGWVWLLMLGLWGLGLARAADAGAMPPVSSAAKDLLIQGSQLDTQGDHDGAIALFTQAIAQGALFEGRLERSYAYAASGHFADALQDLDQAHALLPNNPAPLSARYWFEFELDQFGAVIDTTTQLRGMTPPDPYAPLIRFIAQARLGQDGKADLAKSLTDANKNLWPQAAALMFLGQISPEQLMQSVSQSDNDQAACEVPFYVGEYFLIHQNRNDAQAAFQSNQEDDCREVLEYYAARGELAAMNGEVQ